ncbi:MAG TPA: DM13 domain-containing protein [Blastocatellia bacterium]|nr:DM13 domain-containing protein [Blastocatellia bacterium]
MKLGRHQRAVVALMVGLSGLAGIDCGYTSSRTGRVLASGRFHQVAHRGTGRAAVYAVPGRRLVLRLTDFRTDEGRDLEVLLIDAPDALENETVENANSLSLGSLESVEGDQSYELPDGLELGKYRAVTIWSRRYRVNFTTAPLTTE